jgi:FkbM family methyltransferase
MNLISKSIYAIKYLDWRTFFPILYKKFRRTPLELKLNDGFKDERIDIWFLKQLDYRRKCICPKTHLYEWELEGHLWRISYEQFFGFHEYLDGFFDANYAYDWENKKVLDVGGFIGDSAFFFLKNGAAKVMIFEPVEENADALDFNLKQFKDQIEIHRQALADKDGWITMTSCFEKGNSCFGISPGAFFLSCPCISFSRVLENTVFDVAKIDCEGGERHLIGLESSLLRKVPYWIIETHTTDIYSNLVQKFCKAGFSKVSEIEVAPSVHLIHFQLSV